MPASETPPPRARSLDPAALAENTMRDLALQKELFELYFGQAGVYLDAMRAAIASGDRGEWRAAAHSLKGTARTLGLLWVAEATAAAEAGSPQRRTLCEIEDALLDARAAAAAYVAAEEAAAA